MVEPVDERLDLRATRRLERVQRRLGPTCLEVANDRGRIRKHELTVHEYGHERLAAQLFDEGAFLVGHLHPLGVDALVRKRE